MKDSGIIRNKMIELCFLGTGGSVATENRDNTSFLIKQDDELFLIDCPGGVFQKIKRFNLDPRNVAAILITHIHPDHVYGLPSLVHSLMLDEGRIRLYGSEESVRLCRDLLDLFHLRGKKIKTRIEFVTLDAGESFELEGSVLGTSFKVPHSPSSLAFHFRFKKERKDLVYSGDTPCDPSLFRYAAGKDCLVHDCSAPSRVFKDYPSLKTMHTHSLQLGQHAQGSGIKCLVPCHFFGELDFSLREIEEEIRKNYTGKLIIPEDFERIPL
ncbi:MAG: MBL fold metallo-hydrolase [Candidatus Aminicenantes bacterium]|nr:MAG: MBL fold metallo-hydrolase [Candidatus Aminicenantes bacterium]